MPEAKPVDVDTPPKIAIVSTSLSRAAGGILPIMQQHATGLQRLGVEVSAHGVRDEFNDLDREGWGEVPLHLSDAVGPTRLAFAPGIDRSIATVQPDIIHLHGLWQYPSVAAGRWRKRTGGPVVISAQGMLEEWAIANAGWKKRLAGMLFERDNLRCASAIHVSGAEIPGVRSYTKETPIACLPNGTSFADGTNAPPPSFMLSDNRRTLLFLGRLHPKKGIAETLEAWRLVATRNPGIIKKWRLALVGWDDGGHAESYIAKVNDLGLASDVVMPGALFGVEKEGALAHADAFILASHSEGFPIAVLEALGNSLPVFMTRACNLPEVIDSGAAIEVTTQPQALSKVLETRLSGDYESLRKVGEAGQRFARAHYSWDRISRQLLELYRYLLGRDTLRPDFLLEREMAP